MARRERPRRPRRRLMVALVVTGRVAAEIDGLRRGLGAKALERVAPHVTLVPPVNVGDEELPEALATARRAAAACGPLRLELGPPETFFPVTPVLYLAVGGELSALDTLRRELLKGPLDVPRERLEERPFVPHVTLDHRIGASRLAAATAALADYRVPVTIGSLGVLEQDDTTRHWSLVASYGLARPHVAGRGGLELELSTSAGPDPVLAAWAARQWEQCSLERYGEPSGPHEPFAVVARFAGEVVGAAEGELRGLTLRLARLLVAPEQRGLGVGTQLLRATERLAAEHGCRRIRLETIEGGEAERLYARCGYAVVGRLPAWREERDFVLMERLLAAS